MDRKVLILCTGNSCRSIIAEAVIDKYLPDIEVYSAGVDPTGRINPYAKKVLRSHDAWKERFRSKSVEELEGVAFDLVVTVCDHAKESCPFYPDYVQTLHIGFEDPDGKPYEAFEKTYEEIKRRLLPAVEKALKEG